MTHIDPLVPQNMVERNLLREHRENDKLLEYIAASSRARLLQESWGQSRLEEILAKYIGAKIRRREEEAEQQRQDDEIQFMRERTFYYTISRELIFTPIVESVPIRSTRIALIDQTWHIRRLHYRAWPELYPNGLPPRPSITSQDKLRVRRDPNVTWKDDLLIPGCPSLFEVFPSKTPITSLPNRESFPPFDRKVPPPPALDASDDNHDGRQPLILHHTLKVIRQDAWGPSYNPPKTPSVTVARPSAPLTTAPSSRRDPRQSSLLDHYKKAADEKRSSSRREPPRATVARPSSPLTAVSSSMPQPQMSGTAHTTDDPSSVVVVSLATVRSKRKYVNADSAVMSAVDGPPLEKRRSKMPRRE